MSAQPPYELQGNSSQQSFGPPVSSTPGTSGAPRPVQAAQPPAASQVTPVPVSQVQASPGE